MSGRHETFTAEYCTGETVTLYSQQHHTRIHLQPHGHTNNHIPLNQSKFIYYLFSVNLSLSNLCKSNYKLHIKETVLYKFVSNVHISYKYFCY